MDPSHRQQLQKRAELFGRTSIGGAFTGVMIAAACISQNPWQQCSEALTLGGGLVGASVYGMLGFNLYNPDLPERAAEVAERGLVVKPHTLSWFTVEGLRQAVLDGLREEEEGAVSWVYTASREELEGYLLRNNSNVQPARGKKD